ncbi:MAG: hypothetical protein IPK87_00920 [Planctomycetes bacterium]|nr:hypothetical protein [Planctomycetota bacterium]
MAPRNSPLSKTQKAFFWGFTLVVLGSIAAFVALVAWPWYADGRDLLAAGADADEALARRGLFGDSLAYVGTLAAGIGLCLTAVAVIWQRRDIDLQLAEMKQTAEAQWELAFGSRRESLLLASRELAHQARGLREFILLRRTNGERLHSALSALDQHFVPLLFAIEHDAVRLCGRDYRSEESLSALQVQLQEGMADMHLAIERAMELVRHGYVYLTGDGKFGAQTGRTPRAFVEALDTALERRLPAKPELLRFGKSQDDSEQAESDVAEED